MMNAHRITRTLGTAAGGLLAVGLGIGAALAATPGVASADPSTDPFSWIGGMDLGDLSVPAQTSFLDMQVSIDGMDLFPTFPNTATAFSGPGDIAIAIGNDATANAFPEEVICDPVCTGIHNVGDIAIGIGSFANAQIGAGNYDFAFADGADSLASIANGSNFDLAAAFGDMESAVISAGSFLVDIAP